MNELARLAQALLGPAVPVLPIAGAAYYLGCYLDAHLKPQIRAAYLAYLRDGGLKDHSHSVVDAAADALNVVFGPRHLSWRCFFASALVTVCSITALMVLSGVFYLWIGSDLEGPLLAFLKAYWLAQPGVRLQAALTWIVWSIGVDYVSLFKTRLVIKVLRRHVRWGPLICLGDFIAGFVVYAAGIAVLSLLPFMLGVGWIRPPAVSFELALAFTYIVILWARAFVPGLEAAAVHDGVPADQAAALLHGDAPHVLLAMAFLVQTIPFITIGSDLFYASMMPSIWIWLFVASVVAAKAVAWIGSYLQFALTRFRKPRQTLSVTGGLLIPVILLAIYLVTLIPYGLTGMVFVAKAVLGLVGYLGTQLPDVLTPH